MDNNVNMILGMVQKMRRKKIKIGGYQLIFISIFLDD